MYNKITVHVDETQAEEGVVTESFEKGLAIQLEDQNITIFPVNLNIVELEGIALALAELVTKGQEKPEEATE